MSTASYVLNGDHKRVSVETRDLILAAARDLNYRPNAIARSMARQKTAIIGVIITEIQNPLFAPVTDGVEQILRQEGYQLLLASAGDVTSEIAAIETFLAQQVDGIIIMSLSLHFSDAHLRQLQAEGIPLVVINRDLDVPEIDQIQFDDYGSGRMGTEHLLSLGHTRIGLICGPVAPVEVRRRSAIERRRGWTDALAAQALPTPETWVIHDEYLFEGGYRAAQALIARDEHLTAVFVASDMMAVGALKAFHEAALRVPQDMAVVTIGDPPFTAYTIPALTTLRMPIMESGQIAARVLVESLRGQRTAPECLTLGYELRIRESCGSQLPHAH